MSFQEQAESIRAKAHLTGTKLPVLVGITAIALCVVTLVSFGLLRACTNDAFSINVAEGATAPEAQAPEQNTNDKNGTENAQDASSAGYSADDTQPAFIYVHVSGEVTQPGVIELVEGARVFDAVEAAGGFTENAATSSVNLARVLQDGEQLYVASLEEAVQGAPGGAPSTSGGGAAKRSNPSASAAQGTLVNLNSADVTELESLPGIGEKTAQRIVDDREANGPFASVDDLTRVSGIGEKKLEAIREFVCV
ncbi:ComEA family DNA-binding protein [Adlercreutzia sp. ZJ138]|uniref:ComEA family DNA-binding protein n=1 Tax=Adlercreutzia sp. ZJ138 TaxID=2709405 RepID=UPI0013EA5D7C|nr:ComEA family DNA-binding protein [Adlercreutzia sp. ZJ138]